VIEKLADDEFGTWMPDTVAVMNFVQKLQGLLLLERPLGASFGILFKQTSRGFVALLIVEKGR